MSDNVDVAVTDGFTGNVTLKTLEGGMKAVISGLLAAFAEEQYKAHAEALLPALVPLYNALNPDTYGGAILLGVDGVCIISHGSSGATAIRNAIGVAADMVEHAMVDEIKARSSQSSEHASSSGRLRLPLETLRSPRCQPTLPSSVTRSSRSCATVSPTSSRSTRR